MLHVEISRQVRVFRLARSMFGRSYYYTAAYWVDGLMVDAGCSYTVKELVAALQGLNVTTVVKTHSHEDHVGANAALQAAFGAKVRAHPMALPVTCLPEIKVMTLHWRRLSVRRIHKEIFGKEMRIAYITFGDFSGYNLLQSYVSNAPPNPS